MKSKTQTPKPSANDVVLSSPGWLKRFFWGVEKQTPCTFGTTSTYVDHWLVGDHSWDEPKPC